MLSRPTSSANYRRATDWKTSFIPGGSKPPDDVEYLGPVDLSAKGTWYSLTSTRRLAIVLNVRVPIGPLSILSSPKFFSKCFAACSYICAAAYVYLCFVKIDTTTANIEARESYLYEVLLPHMSPSLASLSTYIFPLSALPLIIPFVTLRVLSSLLLAIPHDLSRGHLPPSFCSSTLTPTEFCDKLRDSAEDYGPFNLVLHTPEETLYVTNNPSHNIGGIATLPCPGYLHVQKLSRGRCYALSNSGLDVPWDKVVRGRRAFGDAIRAMGVRGDEPYGRAPTTTNGREAGALVLLARVLGDASKCRPAVTGCPDALESALARVRIPAVEVPWGGKGERYGTRTSTVVTMDWEGEGEGGWKGVEVWEREWDVDEEGRRVRRFWRGKVEDMIIDRKEM